MRVRRWARVLFATALTLSVTLVTANERAEPAAAAECTPRIGPSIAAPTSVPSGMSGLHAYWYGQSGYPTLCPGQTAPAVVAYYNSGTQGWAVATDFTALLLGTSGPEPGQDQTSVLGGDGTHATEQTRWIAYNRVAAQPVMWIGPNQVAWFQFTVKAPATPGTYRLYLRPLIEGRQWLEDFGVYWQVTVIATSTTPQRVTVATVDRAADTFTAAGTSYHYDANDGFEYGDATVTLTEFEERLTAGDVIDMRYEPAAPERSSFNIVDDGPASPPDVTARAGKFDNAAPTDDVRVDIAPTGPMYNIQRASVPAATVRCLATSGSYVLIDQFNTTGTTTEPDLPNGTYCYRATVPGGVGFFGYSAPVRVPAAQ